MRKVLHIVRKVLPATASFIRNQVTHHNLYRPYLMYAEDVPGEMATELLSSLECKKVVSGWPGTLLYDKIRWLTPGERKKAVAYINELKPDIIHVHYGVDFLTFAQILRKVNIPVVVSFYGYDCTSFPKAFNGLGEKLLQKNVFNHPYLKAVFAMSPDMQRDLQAIGCPDHLIRLHYYGSECETFSYPREYSDHSPVNFTIICGLTAKKGHGILLKAWKMLEGKTRHQIHLTIIGKGELEAQIRETIRTENLQNVQLRGPVKYGSAEHHEALRQADVFVHPSMTGPDGDKEGIPGALIEAMANGLPVVSTYHAGIPYILEHEVTGLLVKENDAEELAGAIMLLADNHLLREQLGRKSQNHALTTLDISSKESELEELYDELKYSSLH